MASVEQIVLNEQVIVGDDLGKKCKNVDVACLKYIIMFTFTWKFCKTPHNLSIRAVGSRNSNWIPPANNSKFLSQNFSLKKDCRGTMDRTPSLHSPVTHCFRHNHFGLLLHVNHWTVTKNSYILLTELCYLHKFPDTCRLTEPVYTLWGIRPLDLS